LDFGFIFYGISCTQVKNYLNPKQKKVMKKKSFLMLSVATFCFAVALLATPTPAKAYYILLSDYSGCWNSGGNCLPEVIVKPPQK
jgi:hypothetical protein